MKVLVIGGTAEANVLCNSLRDCGIPFLLSRAGALRVMPESEHPVRIGGFGGAEGLLRFLGRKEFTHLVLASHPYAKRIAAHAVEAAAACRMPILRIERPPWRPAASVEWREEGSLEEIAAALPSASRTFLAVGRKGLEAFAVRTDVWFMWRVMEPAGPSLRGVEVVAGPVATVEEEVRRMRAHRIECLVAKNSGGSHGYPKIAAAEKLGIVIYFLRRPPLQPCPRVASVCRALQWLQASRRATPTA